MDHSLQYCDKLEKECDSFNTMTIHTTRDPLFVSFRDVGCAIEGFASPNQLFGEEAVSPCTSSKRKTRSRM